MHSVQVGIIRDYFFGFDAGKRQLFWFLRLNVSSFKQAVSSSGEISIVELMKILKSTQTYCFVAFLLFITSCDFHIGPCGRDTEAEDNIIYALNLQEGFVQPVFEFSSLFSGYMGFRYYGISPDNGYLYFTYGYIRNSNHVKRLDLETGEIRGLVIDEYMSKPALSPDGQLFAYQNSKGFVSISDVSGRNPRPIPGYNQLGFSSLPAWSSDSSKLLVNSQGTEANTGTYQFDFTDSTFTKLTAGGSQYNLSLNEESIVYQVPDGIKLKNLITSEIIPVTDRGSYPYLVYQDQYVLTENEQYVFLTVPGSNTEEIYTKSGNGISTTRQNLTVSNSRNRIYIADAGKIMEYAFSGQGIKEIIDKTAFETDDTNDWTSVYTHINRLILSPDDSILYFLVSHRYFKEVNC